MTATDTCPYCRDAIRSDEAVTVCEGCGTRHHPDCYAENGGCTIFGCRCAPAEEPKLSISTPDLVGVAAPTVPAVAHAPVPVPPPPLPGGDPAPAPAAATADEMQLISNRIVPSIFGSFTGGDTIPEPEPEPETPGPPKRRTTYIVLGALLGAFGAHNFYAGYYKKAATQLAITVLTLGFAGPMSWIWAIIDICTMEKDSHGVQFES